MKNIIIILMALMTMSCGQSKSSLAAEERAKLLDKYSIAYDSTTGSYYQPMVEEKVVIMSRKIYAPAGVNPAMSSTYEYKVWRFEKGVMDYYWDDRLFEKGDTIFAQF